jgi:diguanylate cyclase (GGDEF)-like protein
MFVLFATRGPVGGPAAVAAIQACAAGSLALQFSALLAFHGERLRRYWPAVAPLALTPALGLLADRPEARVLAASLLHGGVMVAVVVCLTRLPGEERRLGLRFVTLAYGAAAAVLAARAAMALSHPAAPLLFRGEGMVSAFSALAAFAMAITNSFGFLLMHRERAEAAIERLAMLDPLTGVFNRRSFFDLADRALSQARRHGRSLSLAILDLDHFKRINDTHGHQVGDGVLIHVVEVVQGCLRKSDLLARYGGEEFCLLLPDASAEAALSLTERIRLALEAPPTGAARRPSA